EGVVRVEDDEAVGRKSGKRSREAYLGRGGLAGRDQVAVAEEQLALDLRRAGVERDRQVVANRAPGVTHGAKTHIDGRDGLQKPRARNHQSALEFVDGNPAEIRRRPASGL